MFQTLTDPPLTLTNKFLKNPGRLISSSRSQSQTPENESSYFQNIKNGSLKVLPLKKLTLLELNSHNNLIKANIWNYKYYNHIILMVKKVQGAQTRFFQRMKLANSIRTAQKLKLNGKLFPSFWELKSGRSTLFVSKKAQFFHSRTRITFDFSNLKKLMSYFPQLKNQKLEIELPEKKTQRKMSLIQTQISRICEQFKKRSDYIKNIKYCTSHIDGFASYLYLFENLFAIENNFEVLIFAPRSMIFKSHQILSNIKQITPELLYKSSNQLKDQIINISKQVIELTKQTKPESLKCLNFSIYKNLTHIQLQFQFQNVNNYESFLDSMSFPQQLQYLILALFIIQKESQSTPIPNIRKKYLFKSLASLKQLETFRLTEGGINSYLIQHFFTNLPVNVENIYFEGIPPAEKDTKISKQQKFLESKISYQDFFRFEKLKSLRIEAPTMMTFAINSANQNLDLSSKVLNLSELAFDCDEKLNFIKRFDTKSLKSLSLIVQKPQNEDNKLSDIKKFISRITKFKRLQSIFIDFTFLNLSQQQLSYVVWKFAKKLKKLEDLQLKMKVQLDQDYHDWFEGVLHSSPRLNYMKIDIFSGKIQVERPNIFKQSSYKRENSYYI